MTQWLLGLEIYVNCIDSRDTPTSNSQIADKVYAVDTKPRARFFLNFFSVSSIYFFGNC